MDADGVNRFMYTNYRGERSVRTAQFFALVFKSTERHPEEQWILEGFCCDSNDSRDFALRDIEIIG